MGRQAHSYQCTPAQELDALAAQIPGFTPPERIDPDNTESTAWSATDFADQPGQPPLLWPCWAWGYLAWQHMRDQWRMAPMGGAVALDLTALPVVEERIGMPQHERAQAYSALRVFAREQLSQWAREKARK